ncbi:MAG: AraC family transcriptional regulator [Christensenellales bacterium]|jgi:AraC-like DNA-binding protein
MAVYFSFKGKPGSKIAVEDRSLYAPVEPHMHKHVEIALVIMGSCVHRFQSTELVIIPGDVCVIPPHTIHSYDINNHLKILNLQFFPYDIDVEWSPVFDSIAPKPAPEATGACNTENESARFTLKKDDHRIFAQKNMSCQGIIHLDPLQKEQIERAFFDLRNEQDNHTEYCHRPMMESLFIALLYRLKRAKLKQSNNVNLDWQDQRAKISTTLQYIEEHLSESISCKDLAVQAHLSENYFRTVFKQVTGLSPIEYLHRLRIAKSLPYLQDNHASIGEIAEKVGFYDQNYFTRVFKKVMGYPPIHYKKIGVSC